MNARSRPLLAAVLGLFLCFGVIAGYYVVHKPLTPAVALALGGVFWRLLTTALLISLAGGLGQRLLPAEDLPPLLRLSLQAALGLGLLALGVLAVGMTVGLPVLLLWATPLLLAALLRRQMLIWWRQWGALAALWRSSDRFGRFLALGVGALLLCALLPALAPPVKYDAQIYHLTMPDAYLRLGRVAYLPWIAMTGMPQNTEMLFTWAMALGGRAGAVTLGWGFGVLAVTGLLGYLAWRLDERSAWVGAASLLAGHTLVVSLSWGYVDWLGLYFGLGTLVFLDAFARDGKWQSAGWAGLYAGFALGVKYTAGVLGLVAAGVLLWHWLRRREGSWRPLAAYALGGIGPFLPWMIKNGWTTGNPLYPFFWAAGAMTPVRIAVYQSAPPGGNWLDVWLLPLRATLMGVESADAYSVSMGPLLLGLALVAWAAARPARAERRQAALHTAAGLTVLGYLVWAVSNQFSGFMIQTRFYFPLFSAFAALAAFGFWGISRLEVPGVRMGRIFAALVGLVLVLNLLEVGITTLQHSPLRVLTGLTPEDAYLGDVLGWFYPAEQAAAQLPAGQRALLLYEPRSLYCAPRCAPDEILDRWKRDWMTYATDEAILAAWRQEGFTHLLVNRAGIQFMLTANDPHHPVQTLQALNAFLAKLPEPQRFGSSYELYRLP